MTTNSNHPAVPAAEQDERAAFEAAYFALSGFRPALDKLSGTYWNTKIQDAYLIWQARARMAAPAAGDALDRHSIEGTVRFMRSDADTQVCVCCPPGGGHIFNRHVEWDAWETGHPEHFGKGADVLLMRHVTGINANEGKRVRVTVEILPDAAQQGENNGGTENACHNCSDTGWLASGKKCPWCAGGAA